MKTARVQYPGADKAFLAKVGVLAAGTGKSRALGELCDIASGSYVAPYVARETADSVPYLRVDNVRPYVPNLTDDDVVWIVAPSGVEAKRVSVAAGDVVIARTGTLGKAFVADAALAGAVMSQHLTKLSVRSDSRILPDGLAAYLNSPSGSSALEALATGSTRLELTHSALASLPVPLHLADDEELVTTATGIPRLFATMRGEAAAAIQLADTLFGPASAGEGFVAFFEHLDSASISRSLVPRFWRPEAVTVEERLSKMFECEPLGAIADVFRGAGTHSKEYERDGIPYVRTSSLINHGIDFLPDHYGSERLYKTQGQLVGEGDILLSMEGKIGMTALLAAGERCLVKNHIEIIRPKRDSSWISSYVFAFLASKSGQAQLRRRTVIQATIPGLGSASREVLVPLGARDPANQEQFALVVAEIEGHIQRSLRARGELSTRINRVDGMMRERLAS